MRSSINKTRMRQPRVLETSFSVVSKSVKGKQVNNYLLTKILGVGQYGKVYLARNTETDEIRAVKAIKRTRLRRIGQGSKDVA